jgi:NhaA family Na+:H+ antiporter
VHRVARRLVSPIQQFLAIEAASGIVLIAATSAALVTANSPWSDGFASLWHVELGLSAGSWHFERPLHFWVNDGLMTVFFLIVGLEIRRELHRGSLAEWKPAALPLAAALGGMLVPAAIYAALNHGRAGAAGWGIPMATDIAFAIGVLTLLGKRVPPGLRVLLLALAVIDDIGAIVVIAVFYSGGVDVHGLGIALAGMGGALAVRALGMRSLTAFAIPGLVFWIGLYAAGIHPTLAGVALGLMIPVHAATDEEGREAISLSEHLQQQLHGFVAFVIMPTFALANAGVKLGGADLSGDALYIFVGVTLGLLVGKPLGIVTACSLATSVRLATRPSDVRPAGLGIVGVVGGIGFTMSIFVAHLAFPAGTQLETAKLGVIAGSAASMFVGLVAGALALRPGAPSHSAPAAA